MKFEKSLFALFSFLNKRICSKLLISNIHYIVFLLKIVRNLTALYITLRCVRRLQPDIARSGRGETTLIINFVFAKINITAMRITAVKVQLFILNFRVRMNSPFGVRMFISLFVKCG